MHRPTDPRSPVQPVRPNWKLPLVLAFVVAFGWWSFQQEEPEREKTEEPAPLRKTEWLVAQKARANLVELFSNDDYPAEAIRNEEQGTVAFQIMVDPKGRISDCEVTSSSGSETLDRATCRIVEKRARFQPALGPDGKPVHDIVTSRVRWVLPDN